MLFHATMPSDSEQHPGDLGADSHLNGEEDEVIDPEQITDEFLDHYPKCAGPGECAKDFDSALLQNCTALRMRNIAKQYPSVDARQNKIPLYRSIFEAMQDQQECLICPGGNCDPRVHLFAPMINPPPGWVMGDAGVHVRAPVVPPQTTSAAVVQQQLSSIQTHSSAPAPAPLQLTTSMHGPSGLQQPQLLQGQQQVLPQFGPSLVNNPAALAALNITTQFTSPPAASLRSSVRQASPGTALTRPTGSRDIPVRAPTIPFVEGIVQRPPAPRDPAQVVVQGAAALAALGQISSTAPSTVAQPAAGGMQQLATLDQQAARQRRLKEMQEMEQQVRLFQQQQQQQSQQQLIAAEQAEEQAHQERLRQLRASMTPGTHTNFSSSPGASVSPSFLQPPPPQHAHGHLAPPAHTPNQQVHGFGTAVTGAHSPHSPMFVGSPLVQPQFGASPVGSPAFNQAQLEAMIEQKLQAMSHNHINPALQCNPHGAASSQVCADKGKLRTNPVKNASMAARFGVFAQPVFEIDGDIESGDISKMKKVLTAGYDKTGSGLVYRQAAWPHRMLQANVPGYDTVEHRDLTFHQLMNGMLSALASEIPEERLDVELANRISFMQFLVEMSFSYEHRWVLEAYKDMHMAWQMKVFNWTDSWQSIEDRLKTIRGRYQYNQQPITFKKNFKCSSCKDNNQGGGGAGKPFGGGKQQQKDDGINGVPKSYMRAHNICIRFNGYNPPYNKGCDEKSSHKNKANSEVTLLHICAGCHSKSQAKDEHPVAKCEKGPFKALFRSW